MVKIAESSILSNLDFLQGKILNRWNISVKFRKFSFKSNLVPRDPFSEDSFPKINTNIMWLAKVNCNASCAFLDSS